MKSDSFYKLPKVLFSDDRYKDLSTDAKVLYSLLLDRNSLSVKNGWIDNYGRYYQYFTIKECEEKLNFSHDKIIKLFKELETNGLISRRRQGKGKPSIIYVHHLWIRYLRLYEYAKQEGINTDEVILEIITSSKNKY